MEPLWGWATSGSVTTGRRTGARALPARSCQGIRATARRMPHRRRSGLPIRAIRCWPGTGMGDCSPAHGQTFSSPLKLSQTVHDIQFPDISVTGNGHVYVTYREFADVRSNQKTDAIAYNKSTNCGVTFSGPREVTTFEPYDPTDIS